MLQNTDYPMNGSISRLAYGQGTLPTADEIAELYNQGNGKYYAELSAGLANKVTHYWNLNEAYGVAYDAKSTNDGAVTCVGLLTNNGFETLGAGGADVFASWVEAVAGTSAITDGGAGQAGARCCLLTIDASNSVASITETVLTVGRTYVLTFYAKRSAAVATCTVKLANPAMETAALTEAWAQYSMTFVATHTTLTLSNGTGSTSGLIYIDTVVCNESTTAATTLPATAGPREAIAFDSVGGFHGVLTGMDTVNAWSTDVPNVPSCAGGYSLYFDGVDDFVVTKTADATVQGVEFTWSAWVKPTTLQNDMNFISVNSWDRVLNSSWDTRLIAGRVGAVTTAASAISIEALANNVWSHLAWRYSNAGTVGTARKCYLFINGIECTYGTNIASVGTETVPTGPIRFGWRDGSTVGAQVQGKMDDIRYYNSPLSDADIAILAAGGNPATAPIDHWKFNDGPQYGEPSDGDPICTWESREGSRYQANQITTSLRPIYIRGAVNGQPAIDFDGTDDFLEFIDAIGSGAAGHCMIVSSQDDAKLVTLFGQGDEASADRFFELGFNSTSLISYNQNNAGVVDTLDGNSVAGTSYKLYEWSSNSSLIAMRVNQKVQTITATSGANNGDWAGDVTGADNATLGALKTNAVSKYFAGRIAEVIYWDAALSSANANAVRVELAAKYGITLI
jgi:hypothetical protein